MGIRKPTVSVMEACRLTAIRSGRTPTASTLASPNPSETMASIEQIGRPTGNRTAPAQALPARKAVILSEERHEPDPKVQVFLSAALPARGISASFDMLVRQYRPAKALQMILQRALGDYELMLSDGSFTKIMPVYSVEEPLVVVASSRMMPRRLVDIALAHFDPLGFESARAFGRKLATSALAVFFDRETGRLVLSR
ncbi:VirC2 family conjugal transfer protein [Microvirga tunisiensis]|uniref:Virulence protein n=1 Tax=Microvirga tunisiensis TaxID=2108360 RepID=A0A5N7MQ79_9HYPH|nr:VirC2 family conjugal transfer protein [Microvirga tunisiensis]MPR11050.1 virulence protein [Microvirga tunisiensis]MPR29155.1 virulence protein [Microvirga tunisiensis]